MHLFLFFHGPIERHIKFNSQSPQHSILRIIEPELSSDSSHCHETFWALFTAKYLFSITADLCQLLWCQWAAPHLWCVGPTRVARGQREVREWKPFNVHLSFPNIYRCGILWWGFFFRLEEACLLIGLKGPGTITAMMRHCHAYGSSRPPGWQNPVKATQVKAVADIRAAKAHSLLFKMKPT